MSTIRPDLASDPRLDRGGFDAFGVADRLAPDPARADAAAAPALAELAFEPQAPLADFVDPGEAVLNAPAWEGAARPHLLGTDAGLAYALDGADLQQSAARAADAILGPLGIA